jgi:hypothetical protein
MRSLMKKDSPEPTPAVRYTKEMKFEIWEGLEPDDIPKAFWKPGREGTMELEPWSHAMNGLVCNRVVES